MGWNRDKKKSDYGERERRLNECVNVLGTTDEGQERKAEERKRRRLRRRPGNQQARKIRVFLSPREENHASLGCAGSLWGSALQGTTPTQQQRVHEHVTIDARNNCELSPIQERGLPKTVKLQGKVETNLSVPARRTNKVVGTRQVWNASP